MPADRAVLILQHAPWETPGRIADALAARALPTRTVDLIAAPDAELPAAGELAGLVVMGGPMRATDVAGHPGLGRELALIAAAVEAGVPVLGVCLGHQLLGVALGGVLDAGATHEVGVGPVQLVADSPLGAAGDALEVLHWHGDNVSLPTGAELLARTEGCPNQAFRRGSALGVQFHLEVDAPLLDRWLGTPEMLADLPDDGAAVRAAFAPAAPALRTVGDRVFGSFADLIA